MFARTYSFFAMIALLLSHASARGAAAITYHGRLLGPEGQAVEASGVTFKIQVRSPGTANCLLYEESRTIDMRNSDGVFVIPIGDGSSSRTASDPGITIEEVFSNGPVNHAGLACNSGHAYQPATLDARKLVVTFNDGSGSGDQALPPMDVNYVPFALHSEEATSALKVGAVPASQVMSVSGGAATPLSAANFAELVLLVNGNSNAYLKPASVPTCAGGEVLKGTGGAFVCVTDASGTDTLAGIACADGKILKRAAGAWACGDDIGVGSEVDPSVQPYAKSAPGTGLKVTSNLIVPDFGTGAGKVVEGNDSRFPSGTCSSGSYNRWNGSVWVCDAGMSTDSTKVLKTGDTVSGTLLMTGSTAYTSGLADSAIYLKSANPSIALFDTAGTAGYEITSIANGDLQFATGADASGAVTPRVVFDSSGNVGIGTNSPGQKLSVAGTIETTSGGVKYPDATTQTSANNVTVATVSVAGATTLSLPAWGHSLQNLTMAASATVNIPAGTWIGQFMTTTTCQNGTGGYTPTFAGSGVTLHATYPSGFPTTTANKCDVCGWIYYSTNNWILTGCNLNE